MLLPLIIDLSEKSFVWLGAADIHQEGDWKWYNPETPFNFHDWSSASSQPDEGRSANCLAYWKSSAGYNWAEQPCRNQFYFICEK